MEKTKDEMLLLIHSMIDHNSVWIQLGGFTQFLISKGQSTKWGIP